MRRPLLAVAPILVVIGAGAALLLFRESRPSLDPRPLKSSPAPSTASGPVPSAPPTAESKGQNTPAGTEVPGASAKPLRPPAFGWRADPDRARNRWAKDLVEKKPTLTRDELLAELARIELLPEGEERIDRVRALFGSDQIDRSAADRLLGLYDRSGPGDFRKVLFGALLFSSAGDYVAEQMLLRTRSQSPDDRDYTYYAHLTSRHGEVWDLLCESVPACTGEAGASRAALAIAGMAKDYPPVSGGAAQAERLQGLISQTTWNSAKLYLFQALLAIPGSEGVEAARKALSQESDPELRRDVLKMSLKLGR
jgi:hypothetical protein